VNTQRTVLIRRRGGRKSSREPQTGKFSQEVRRAYMGKTEGGCTADEEVYGMEGGTFGVLKR
jgi:hypothetical protein